MFDKATIAAITSVAQDLKLDPAGLLAVVEVESGGKAFAMVEGKAEPLIRFEGHYFDRRLTRAAQKQARAAGLASPKAGAIANPNSQAARWKLLARAVEIDAQAAFESVSWGVGQVMGAHWQWLGFGTSVTTMVELCRRDVAGQVTVMVRYIDKAGLMGALRGRDWATFARGYNGPQYKRYSYDTQLAAAYRRNLGTMKPVAVIDHAVVRLQERLTIHGFPVEIDGVRGKQTDAALRAFQKAKKLVVDGKAGSASWAALDADPT